MSGYRKYSAFDGGVSAFSLHACSLNTSALSADILQEDGAAVRGRVELAFT